MKKMHMVIFKFARPDVDRGSFFEAIQKFSGWCRFGFDGPWIVTTDLGAFEVRDSLGKHLTSDDWIVVASLTTEAAWRNVPDSNSKWLSTTLPRVGQSRKRERNAEVNGALISFVRALASSARNSVDDTVSNRDASDAKAYNEGYKRGYEVGYAEGDRRYHDGNDV